jgi:hypothetical protein
MGKIDRPMILIFGIITNNHPFYRYRQKNTDEIMDRGLGPIIRDLRIRFLELPFLSASGSFAGPPGTVHCPSEVRSFARPA